MFLCLFQGVSPYVMNRFLAKVLQYLKYKNLESKYACAFVLITPMATKLEILEVQMKLLSLFEYFLKI